MRTQLHALFAVGGLLLVSSATGCGDDDDGTTDTQVDAGGAADDAGSDTNADIPVFNGCSASMYVDHSAESDTREIKNQGLAYSPRCLIIAKGQTVVWNVSMTTHPLSPGNADDPGAGSAGSPIEATTSGNSAEFTFDEEGTFPYHCTIHSSGAGVGMAGSIHVIP